jgi:hypothetical protein
MLGLKLLLKQKPMAAAAREKRKRSKMAHPIQVAAAIAER